MTVEQKPDFKIPDVEKPLQELSAFIESNPDPRELKRAVAVRMVLSGIETIKIRVILGVSKAFISKWKVRFIFEGVEGLKLGYQGAKSLLNPQEREDIIEWLRSKDYWSLEELNNYILEKYNVQFKSAKSYYNLFKEAGITWKKSQKINPKTNPDEVKKRREEIQDLLAKNRADIEAGKLVVYMIDECHLLWGDACGYVWGNTKKRIEIPITNEREKQTYYGALNFHTKEFHVEAYDSGNSENTVRFLKSLQAQNPGSRILVIWDGASYHKSKVVREFLSETNKELPASEWKIHCENFAPNDPNQNPVEDVWLQAKNFVRKYWYLCRNFKIVKWLFVLATHGQKFNLPKINWYKAGCYS
jgi:putative transposase